MIIQKLKETIGIFSRKQATSVNWPEVTENIELEAPLVECESGHFTQGYGSYIGIPAPVYLEDDEWFGPAPVKTEKQLDYMEQEIEMKRQEREENFSIEPDDIHQKMYEIVTQNQNTTLHLNPPGGSENFHEGPGGWSSGNGREQFL